MEASGDHIIASGTPTAALAEDYSVVVAAAAAGEGAEEQRWWNVVVKETVTGKTPLVTEHAPLARLHKATVPPRRDVAGKNPHGAEEAQVWEVRCSQTSAGDETVARARPAKLMAAQHFHRLERSGTRQWVLTQSPMTVETRYRTLLLDGLER